MKETELKLHPCYHCGGEMEIRKVSQDGGMDGMYWDWKLTCKKCGLTMTYPADDFYGRKYITFEEAVDDWNRNKIESEEKQMNKTYVETFKDMVNTMLNKESFTSDPNAVNSVYMGQIALSLSAITDELHELNMVLKHDLPAKERKELQSEKDNIVRLDHLASADEINGLRKEFPSENAQEPEYPQPEFAYELTIDATTVVSLMYNEIEKKGYVTVAEVKRFSNEEPNELDNLYGWYNIDPFETLEMHDFKNIPPKRCLLNLPKVERIKEIK